MNIVFKRFLLMLSIIVVAAVVVACGNDSSEEATTEEGDASENTEENAESNEADASSSEGEEVESLSMGFIPSSDAGNIATTAEPLEEFLSEALGIEVNAEVMVDYSGLIEAMRTQQVDIGFLAPFSFVQAEDRANVEVILKSIRNGSESYTAQYIVNADSDIESIDDLIAEEGLVWAYPDTLSTSGYLFPAAQMKEMGIENLESHFQQLSVGGHDNAVTQVYDGQADFATTFDDARATVEEELPDVMDQVKVIGNTDEIPNDTISVRSELPEDMKQQITDAFMSLNDNEEMLEVMYEIYEWDGLAEASSEDYDIVRDVYAEFEEELSE
ncbi:phosphate/phosphite/phosphonate ABC transporter substrate-binding protein [Salinicoccus sesuvii]|uniref:Phosphate/phosphite/phosphonate ABC transporter substrate-binding protein n=1 Tax=Salinicoccus sesuvii TaxID=868281 RepID=A0ABV7N3D5_9STAP